MLRIRWEWDEASSLMANHMDARMIGTEEVRDCATRGVVSHLRIDREVLIVAGAVD